jgi:hypothetical protein
VYCWLPIKVPGQFGVFVGPLHGLVPVDPFTQPQVGGGGAAVVVVVVVVVVVAGVVVGPGAGVVVVVVVGVVVVVVVGAVGVTELDAADKAENIPLLSVLTVKVYGVPLTKPVTVIGLVKLLATIELGVEVAT